MRRKLSRTVKTGRIMGVACLEFRGENFRGWRKNREIRESFLPRKFPAIRYDIHATDMIYVYYVYLLFKIQSDTPVHVHGHMYRYT